MSAKLWIHKRIVLFFLILLLVLIATSSLADSIQAGDFTILPQPDGTCEITRYTGTDAVLTVPETLGGYRVTGIAVTAFRESDTLKQVVLPDSITHLGFSVFSNCRALTSAVLPSRLTQIADGTFRGCESLTDIRLPSGITSIGKIAFNNCSSLEELSLPESVTSIGALAFECCGKLRRLYIPEGVQTLEGVGLSPNTELYCYEGSSAAAWAQANGQPCRVIAKGDGGLDAARSVELSELRPMVPGESQSITVSVFPDTDQPEILLASGDPSILSAENGTVKALNPGTAEMIVAVGSKVVRVPVTVLPKAVFNWKADGNACEVFVRPVGTADPVPADSVQIQSAPGLSPACAEPGTTVYTATAEWNGETFCETFECTDVPPLGHDYESDFSLEEGSDQCRVTLTCARCGDKQFLTAPAQRIGIGSVASCTDPGTTVYTASAEWNGKTFHGTFECTDVPPLGHDYESDFSLEEGSDQCRITLTCARCGDKQALTTPIENVGIVSPSTCISHGTTEYKASLTYEGKTYTGGPFYRPDAPLGEHRFAPVPGCLPEGKKPGLTAGIQCELCGYSSKPQEEVFSLNTLTLPEHIINIGAHAFHWSAAQAVFLSEGTESIGAFAFSEMQNLLFIRFPTSVRTIEGGALDGCPPLVTIICPESASEVIRYAKENGFPLLIQP